jgi:hypothetical protein
LVGAVGRLGHHPVEAGALEAGEPVGGQRPVEGAGGEVHAGRRGQSAFEQAAAFGQGDVEQRPIAQGQQVEGHERRRGLGRQPVDAGLGRVDALLEGVEVQAVGPGHHDLAVDHAPIGEGSPQRAEELREVAGEGPVVAGPQLELVAVAEHDAPEAVPLGLEPDGTRLGRGQLRSRLGQHGGERGQHRQVHPAQRTATRRGPGGEVGPLVSRR